MSFQNHLRRPRHVLCLLGRVLHTSSVGRGGRDSGPLRDLVSQTSQVALALLSRRCLLLLKGDLPWTTNSTSRQLSTPNVSFFMKICTVPLRVLPVPTVCDPCVSSRMGAVVCSVPSRFTVRCFGFQERSSHELLGDRVARPLAPSAFSSQVSRRCGVQSRRACCH